MSRNFNLSLIIAAVSISWCQAADRPSEVSTLAELFKPDNIQHVIRGLKHEEVLTVKLVDGSIASATHESDGSKDTYSAAIAQKKVGMGGFTPRDFEFVGVTQGEHYELTHPANPQEQFDLIKQAFQQQEQEIVYARSQQLNNERFDCAPI